MTPQTPSPPSPSHSSSSSSFPILAISLLGILTTTFLLLSYYIFVIKCFLNRHRTDDFLGRRLSRSRRYLRSRSLQLMAYVTGAAAENRGLGESAIQAIPTLRYRKGGEGAEKTSFHECAVCLNEFQEEERIRLLPNCLHTFHIDCIDVWLQTNDNCPLCRSSITASSPLPAALLQRPELQPQRSDRDVVIEVGDDGSRELGADPSARRKERRARRHAHVSSMGDEFIDVAGSAKDELFRVQPMRRSFSMDSSGDRRLGAAVQKVLQQNLPRLPEAVNAGESSSGGSGRFRRQFFSFTGARVTPFSLSSLSYDRTEAVFYLNFCDRFKVFCLFFLDGLCDIVSIYNIISSLPFGDGKMDSP